MWKVSILGATCDIKSPFCQSNENLFSYNNEMWDNFFVWSYIFVYFNFYFALIVVKHPVEQFYLQVTNTIGIGIDQSDIAPMISTLLDINFPAHSDGQVPFHLLNISTQNIGTDH